MKNVFTHLIPRVIALALLQSCQRNEPLHRPADDKLLLSKVTGHLTAQYLTSFNPFAYDQYTGNYAASYSYADMHTHRGEVKVLDKIDFISAGSWNFLYQNLKPDRTIDNSIPGLDAGYWKYYTNSRGQIEKTGLSFKSTDPPREYEFYTYNDKDELVSLIYGRYADSPYFKLGYDYDYHGNLTGYTYYYPNGYIDAAGKRSMPANSGFSADLGKLPKHLQTRLQQLSRLAPKEVMRGARSAPDSNVVYGIFFTTKITGDQMNNPYNQQNRFLFYQTNRNYYLNLTDFFLPLLKHNPVSVAYNFDLGDGTFGHSEQDYSYTYDEQHFPVTVQEVNSDPDAMLWGDYTQNFSIEYIRNY